MGPLLNEALNVSLQHMPTVPTDSYINLIIVPHISRQEHFQTKLQFYLLKRTSNTIPTSFNLSLSIRFSYIQVGTIPDDTLNSYQSHLKLAFISSDRWNHFQTKLHIALKIPKENGSVAIWAFVLALQF